MRTLRCMCLLTNKRIVDAIVVGSCLLGDARWAWYVDAGSEWSIVGLSSSRNGICSCASCTVCSGTQSGSRTLISEIERRDSSLLVSMVKEQCAPPLANCCRNSILREPRMPQDERQSVG
jgi:hypothetical protein